MNRKYPKNNRPGGYPQDEANTHSEPKLPRHRRDVAAQFLLVAAAIVLAIAGFHFSTNKPVAIACVWLGGVLSVASCCFFWAAREQHPAIRRVWWTGFVLVSIACVVWAWIARSREPFLYLTTDEGAHIIVPESDLRPPPATPTPTPSKPTQIATPPATGMTNNKWNAFHFTPKQISEKIKGASTDWEKEDMKKAFEGLSVDWVLGYFSGRRAPNVKQLFLAFRAGPDEEVLVMFRLPLAGNEHFLLTEPNQQFRVRGVIKSITADRFIDLEDTATFEKFPEGE